LALEPKLEYTHDQLNRYTRKEQADYQDAQVRENNPTVKKAWEKYQMLLGLAR
jgi:hypothetical protein